MPTTAKLQLAKTAFPSCAGALCAFRNDRRKVNPSNSMVCTGQHGIGIHRKGLLGLNVSCHHYLQAWTINGHEFSSSTCTVTKSHELDASTSRNLLTTVNNAFSFSLPKAFPFLISPMKQSNLAELLRHESQLQANCIANTHFLVLLNHSWTLRHLGSKKPGPTSVRHMCQQQTHGAKILH